MTGFNPFVSPQAKEIELKIKHLKQQHPDLSRRELAKIIIRKKCRQCALVGVVTALPATVPGIGTVIALFGGVATDIIFLSYLLARLVLEIAALYDRDLTGQGYQKRGILGLCHSYRYG